MPRSRRPNLRARNRHPEGEPQGERLQKVLAAAGIASRRDCEELIVEGRVEVDRKVVSELGARVDPSCHEIRVDGIVLSKPKRVYFALNKPPGVVCTNHDPSGRARVIDLIDCNERIFPVGRLDRGSEGLIVVTNDGEFANRLTHPRFGVEKTYYVRVAGEPKQEDLERLKKGIYISEGLCKVSSLKVLRKHKQSTDLEIVLKEGKNREIRRILAKIGHKALTLRRVAIGPLRLATLKLGAYRRLRSSEVEELLSVAKRTRKKRPVDRTSATSVDSRKPSKNPYDDLFSEPFDPTGTKAPKKPPALPDPETLGDLRNLLHASDDDDDDLDDEEMAGSDIPSMGGEDDDQMDIEDGFEEDWNPSPSAQGVVIAYEDDSPQTAPPHGRPAKGKRPWSKNAVDRQASRPGARAKTPPKGPKGAFPKKPGKRPFGGTVIGGGKAFERPAGPKGKFGGKGKFGAKAKFGPKGKGKRK